MMCNISIFWTDMLADVRKYDNFILRLDFQNTILNSMFLDEIWKVWTRPVRINCMIVWLRFYSFIIWKIFSWFSWYSEDNLIILFRELEKNISKIFLDFSTENPRYLINCVEKHKIKIEYILFTSAQK